MAIVDFTTYTDQELVRSMRSRDERVLVEIYNRYWDKMLAVAFNRLGNQEEAEECVQDVLYRLWKRGEDLTLANNSLSGYLARAIRNYAFNMLDKRYREKLRAEGFTPEIDMNVFTPERQMILRELQQQIDQAIQALPPQCQLVFTLKQEGHSNKQIADKLQLSENTVKSHLKRANKGMRDHRDLLILFLLIRFFLHS